MITHANIEQAAEAAHQLNKRLSQLRGYFATPEPERQKIAGHVSRLERAAETEFDKLAGVFGRHKEKA